MYIPKGEQLENEFFFKRIKNFYQYTHVMGNCEGHCTALGRLVEDKPYDYELGFFGERDEWDKNRERHIKDLTWAIDIQLRQLMEFCLRMETEACRRGFSELCEGYDKRLQKIFDGNEEPA